MTLNNFDMLSINKNFSTNAFTAVASKLNAQEEVSNGNKKSFDSYLLDAVSQMNDQQLEVNRLSEKSIVEPESVDIHDITTAMAKAQMSLSLAKTVVDRVVTGWNEITTTR